MGQKIIIFLQRFYLHYINFSKAKLTKIFYLKGSLPKEGRAKFLKQTKRAGNNNQPSLYFIYY